tara:strand:- start:1278 stop:1436 length:159 start_codon:yes stop_codon:yes gene_type:complete
MKKLILTIIFFVIGIFKPRKVDVEKDAEHTYSLTKNNLGKKKVKIKRYRNNS